MRFCLFPFFLDLYLVAFYSCFLSIDLSANGPTIFASSSLPCPTNFLPRYAFHLKEGFLKETHNNRSKFQFSVDGSVWKRHSTKSDAFTTSSNNTVQTKLWSKTREIETCKCGHWYLKLLKNIYLGKTLNLLCDSYLGISTYGSFVSVRGKFSWTFSWRFSSLWTSDYWHEVLVRADFIILPKACFQFEKGKAS